MVQQFELEFGLWIFKVKMEVGLCSTCELMISPAAVKNGLEISRWTALEMEVSGEHTQPFNGLLSWTTQVGQYQKKHSPTPTHPDHQTSFINFLHLLWSIASSLFSLHARLSSLTTFLQVLFGLPLGLGPTGFQYPLWLVSFLLPAPTILGLYAFSSSLVLLATKTRRNCL